MNFRNVSDFLNKNELMNFKFVLNTFFYIKKKRQELAINQTYIKITNFKLKKKTDKKIQSPDIGIRHHHRE